MNQRKNNLFTQVPTPKVSRNLFDLSHEVKMSGKFGYLYPILCMDTLPGDNIRDTMNCMIRFAPMLAPVMHRMDVTTHFFFVPNRIITDHWEDFITGGQDGLATPILPYVSPFDLEAAGGILNVMGKGTLWDYLGLPTIAAADIPAVWTDEHISALPFRACAKVWNDYYRDPNFHAEFDLNTEMQGDVSAEMLTSMIMDISQYRRAFEKDYFTSALPWAQRGAQVLMPLSGIADDNDITYKNPAIFFDSNTQTPAGGGNAILAGGAGGGNTGLTDGVQFQRIENIESITFENAATTINDFRRALAIQRWLEANARGGARYVEQIQGHFQVTVPDYRLQRAEYIGGGKQPVQISEVLATGGGSVGLGDAPVGDMSGHGISVGRTNRFNYRCQEHGWVVGFLSVTMRTAYQQGIAKMWTRADKYEHAWPELAHLGEQEILSKEIFFSYDVDDEPSNDMLFGYTPRYSEYKFMNDRVAGDFRDNLGFWHLGRIFVERPVLDENFTTIEENGTDEGLEQSFRRIFAVQDGTDYLWMQLYHHLTAKRPLPYFGVPKII